MYFQIKIANVKKQVDYKLRTVYEIIVTYSNYNVINFINNNSLFKMSNKVR